jgi:hypothetical protein
LAWPVLKKPAHGPAIGHALDLNQFAKPEKGGISGPPCPRVSVSLCQGPTAAVLVLYRRYTIILVLRNE